MFSAEAYARMQKLLLPPGKVWKLIPASILSKVFLAAGDELERVDGRGQTLIDESDPRTAVEMLAEYERVLDLPSTGTDAERQARIVALLISRRRFRPVDFQEALAPIFGLDVSDVVVIETSRADAIAQANDTYIYRFYVYRNPALAGTWNIVDAQNQIEAMQPAHTEGKAIESIRFTCNDPMSLVNRDLLALAPVV